MNLLRRRQALVFFTLMDRDVETSLQRMLQKIEPFLLLHVVLSVRLYTGGSQDGDWRLLTRFSEIK